MNTELSVIDIEYLLTQQKRLDADIREKKDISVDEWRRGLQTKQVKALKIEASEFVNEMHDAWKYWKDKPVNRERILDEAVDVIHFCCLLINKTWLSYQQIIDLVNDEMTALRNYFDLDNLKDEDKLDTIDHIQDDMLNADDLNGNAHVEYHYFGYTLVLLDLYGFTTKDIIDQYNKKNAVNFERLSTGY